jgi:hypothetical protein
MDMVHDGEVLGGHTDVGTYRNIDVDRLIQEGALGVDDAVRQLGKYCFVIKWGLDKLITMCRHEGRVRIYRFRGLNLDNHVDLARAIRILGEGAWVATTS